MYAFEIGDLVKIGFTERGKERKNNYWPINKMIKNQAIFVTDHNLRSVETQLVSKIGLKPFIGREWFCCPFDFVERRIMEINKFYFLGLKRISHFDWSKVNRNGLDYCHVSICQDRVTRRLQDIKTAKLKKLYKRIRHLGKSTLVLEEDLRSRGVILMEDGSIKLVGERVGTKTTKIFGRDIDMEKKRKERENMSVLIDGFETQNLTPTPKVE